MVEVCVFFVIASCDIETIDVCICRMFVFMYVVVTVWRSVRSTLTNVRECVTNVCTCSVQTPTYL